MENIKYLFKLLGLKIALCGLKKKKYIPNWINSGVDITDRKISECGSIAIKIIQYEREINNSL